MPDGTGVSVGLGAMEWDLEASASRRVACVDVGASSGRSLRRTALVCRESAVPDGTAVSVG